VRVRKLARELRRTPSEVLGALHALGYERYKSSQDMIADSLVAKVRQAMRSGRQYTPVLPRDGAPKTVSEVVGNDHLMAQLVPGVVQAKRQNKRLASSENVDARGAGRVVSERPVQTSAASQVVEVPNNDAFSAIERARELLEHTRDNLRADRDALEGARARVAAVETESREQLELERAALDAEREALEAERGALSMRWREVADQERWIEERRSKVAARCASVDEREAANRVEAKDVERARRGVGTPLEALLEARGLRGRDEGERAVSALAKNHVLRDLLPHLRVSNADAVEALLRRHLVLVEVASEDHGDGAYVVVAPGRAEIPRQSELRSLIRRVGESFLLNGLRRVVMVNVPPRWQRILTEGLDSRLEVRFRPGASPRGRTDAEGDVTRTEAVVLVGLSCTDDAEQVYKTGRAVVLRVAGGGLGRVLTDVRDALAAQ
jgi:hypothetical protein